MAIAKLTLKRTTEPTPATAPAPLAKKIKTPLLVQAEIFEDAVEEQEEIPCLEAAAECAEVEVEVEEVEEVEEAPAPVAKVRRLLKKTEEVAPPAAAKTVAAKTVAPKPAIKTLAAAKPVLAEVEDTIDEVGENVERTTVVYNPSSMGTIDGDITERDVQRPRLQLMQANNSDLEEKGFTVGQVALNGEVLVWDKGCEPLSMVLMTGRKKFVQKLTDQEYKDGIYPLIFDSADQVKAAGFTMEWIDDEPPQVDPVLYALFLVEQPDFIEPDPVFSLEYGNRKFALAEMKFTGINYRTRGSGANWLITQSRTSLAPESRMFMIGMTTTREKQKSSNIVTVAQFRNQGRHTDQNFIEWVLSLG